VPKLKYDFPEALLMLTAWCPLPSDEMRADIRDTILSEFGLLPDAVEPADPRDALITEYEKRLAALAAHAGPAAAPLPPPVAPPAPVLYATPDAAPAEVAPVREIVPTNTEADQVAALRAQLAAAGITPTA
jgi:hypothetical protein